MSDRWLNGWKLDGDTVLHGNATRCAGCGKVLGIVTVIVKVETPKAEPDWPFDGGSCPVCNARNIKCGQPRDRLTDRLLALRDARSSHE